jgi:signal transduction histidine kinase/CheY-like chemotaxis protein
MLSNIGIIELLEQDARPTFILDLSEPFQTSTHSLHLIYTNTACRSNTSLTQLLQLDTETSESSQSPSLAQFHQWLTSSSPGGAARNYQTFSYGNVLWTKSTVRQRYRVVSGLYESEEAAEEALKSPLPQLTLGVSTVSTLQGPKASAANDPASQKDYFENAITTTHEPTDYPNNAEPAGDEPNQAESQKAPDTGGSVIPKPVQDIGFFDWTRLPISDSMPAHIRFARSIDWDSTALGPIEEWSSDLRLMCNLIMASPHPAAMYWGEHLVAIYNEAYVELAGQKHPKLMGVEYRHAWKEIWDEVKDVFDNAKRTGQATMKDDDQLFLRRSNYTEETFFSWSIIPVIGDFGAVSGLYNPAFENTRRKVAERRMFTLRTVGEKTADARDVKSFWKEVEAALEPNPYDAPFVLLYSVSSADDQESDTASIYSSSHSTSKTCILEASLGVPEGHQCAPAQIDLKSGTEGFGPIFREVLKEGIVILRVKTGRAEDEAIGASPPPTDPEDRINDARLTIPLSMLEGIGGRGYGDQLRGIVVIPVQPIIGDNSLDPVGFIVLGLNPRRPYDQDCHLFVELLSRSLGTSLASVVLFEEEIKRGQKAAELAAQDRILLSQQLAVRTQEARDMEARIIHMAKANPAGLFEADADGHITYTNDSFYDIAGIPNDPTCADKWIDYIKESDRESVRNLWSDLLENSTGIINQEFCFNKEWQDENGNTSDTWVLFSAHPETSQDADGNTTLKTIFGTIANISLQKWAQDVEIKRVEEAMELKRQQENFIDITSHEMRNPLSAVVLCADEVCTDLTEINVDGLSDEDKELVKRCISSAETIILCSQHQKRIVDDILTLSKLDSNMLMVTPVDAQPLNILERSLKMFESETNTAGIRMQLAVDDSFKRLKIDWAKLDPQRISQILINLMTNAIKFSSDLNGEGASITLSIAASLQRFSLDENPIVEYFPARIDADANLLTGEDWGDGEEIFIQYAVKDTGPGLAEEDRNLMFNRFTQASPRTHVMYGGSGLGLFISRQLAELQGGEIGVASEAGKGSTFAFYIHSRRSEEPDNPELGIPANLKNISLLGRRAGDRASAAELTKKRAEISILIVEDNLVNQRILQRQLAGLGFTILVANHGADALEKLRKSQFWSTRVPEEEVVVITVVLMDQEMPVMDGLEATIQIRSWETSGELNAHVPIVGVTANARREQIDALLAAGMVGTPSFSCSAPTNVHRMMLCLSRSACPTYFPKWKVSLLDPLRTPRQSPMYIITT